MRGLPLLALVVVCLPSLAGPTCTDLDGDSWFRGAGCEPLDCNDLDPFVNPGATESCNGIDDDCDGLIDELPACPTVCPDPFVVDPPVAMSPTGEFTEFIAVTPDGYGVLASGPAWQLHVVDRAGTLIAGPHPITANGFDPAILWDGEAFAVAWRLGATHYFGRMRPDGSWALDPIVVDSLAASQQIEIGFSGDRFGLVYGTTNLRFLTVSVDGQLSTPVNFFGSPDESVAAAPIWSGSTFLVAVSKAGAGILTVFDDAGNALTPATTVLQSNAEPRGPGVIWHDGLLRWWYTRFGATRVSDFDANGDVVGSFFGFGVSLGAIPRPIAAGDDIYVTFDVPPGQSRIVRAIGGDPAQSTSILIPQSLDGTPLWNGERFGITTPPTLTYLTCDCSDVDVDGFSICNGDCDDVDASVFPGAPQLCDGVNNDCDAPDWPTVAPDEIDEDQDGAAICAGDCEDQLADVFPGAPEQCNARDDDCDGLIDEIGAIEDDDEDAVRDVCDNCPDVFNQTQIDSDADGVGNSCDNCVIVGNPAQLDTDGDARGDACDNCPVDVNFFQDDTDLDLVGDACDNCLFDPNPDQSDVDADLEGDVCDLDDGMILLTFATAEQLSWGLEGGFDSWNLYRGALDDLTGVGAYTQQPGSNPAAARFCDLSEQMQLDGWVPAAQAPAFYLVTGSAGGQESPLGSDGSGGTRDNGAPCP